MSAGDEAVVVEMLRRRMGLAYSESRLGEVKAAIRRKMSAARVSDPAVYVERVARDQGLMNALVAECTVGETYFFREPEQLDFIRREVFAELRDRRPTGPIRIWSAGCASGEEAYSLGILLRESPVAERASVIGTDAARARLSRAREGRYRRWSLRGVPDAVVQRYFSAQGKQFELAPAIRRYVSFRYLNLAADDYPSSRSGVWGMDLILCRNVLIYLDRDVLAGVAERLYRTLAPGGWLFLAASDPSLAALAPFETLATDHGIVYRRPVTPTFRAHPPAVRPTAASTTDRQPAGDVEGRSADGAPARTAGPAVPAADAEASHSAVSAVRDLADRGQLTEAGRACAAALEQDKTSTELLYLHAVLLVEAGHFQEAAAAARRVLYLSRDFAVAHLVLGSALKRLDDHSGARRSFRNAVRALGALDPAEAVPGSGGEPAGRLLDLATAQLGLLEEIDA